MSIEKAQLLLALLADGQPRAVADLLPYFDSSLPMINGARQSLPEEWQQRFRQQDGLWQLKRPSTVMHQNDEFWEQNVSSFAMTILNECESTNTYLRERLSQENLHRHVVITNLQTAGKGRQGKTWQSQLGDSLTFSFVWSFNKQQAQLGALALITALAIQETLKKHHVHAQIKWPNDIVVGQQKMGGILIETKKTQHETAVIVGVGLNFAEPLQVEQQNTHIWSQQQNCQPKKWLADFLSHVSEYFNRFAEQGFQPFIEHYRSAHRDEYQMVQLHRHGQLIHEGKVIGVDNNGALLLETDSGLQKIVTGEVSLRIKKNAEEIQSSTMAGAKQVTDLAGIGTQPKYLLLDAGNSQLKWALVQQGKIIETGKAPYGRLQPLGEFFQEHNDIIEVVGCAVCGEQKMAAVAEQLPKPITWLSSMAKGLGIVNHYMKPEEHGSDRWFNILGSRRFSQEACVVVSCGTAITIDALTAENHYLGGSIMPGFNLMKEAMALKTANLNQPVGRAYPFATSTANAIASGMLDAACGALILMYQRLKEKTAAGKNVKVLLTGGGAKKIEQHLPKQFIEEAQVEIIDNLVIYGLLNWIEQE